MLELLAQSAPSEKAKFDVILWAGILMGIVIIGGLAIMMLRNKLRTYEDPGASANAGFSLSDLREMRDREEITSEEYEITKAKIVSKVRASADKAAGKMKGDGE